jgi:hypothetical protein
MHRSTTLAKRTPPKPTVRQLIGREPKMPAAQSRRLNELLDRSKEGRLSARERRELGLLVENVDRQSFLMVANALMKYISLHGGLPPKGRLSPRKPSRRRATK